MLALSQAFQNNVGTLENHWFKAARPEGWIHGPLLLPTENDWDSQFNRFDEFRRIKSLPGTHPLTWPLLPPSTHSWPSTTYLALFPTFFWASYSGFLVLSFYYILSSSCCRPYPSLYPGALYHNPVLIYRLRVTLISILSTNTTNHPQPPLHHHANYTNHRIRQILQQPASGWAKTIL